MKDNEKSNTGKKKRKRPPRKPPSWDQSKALDLAQKGVNQHDIAMALHVHVNTIHRYLQRIKPELAQIQTFNDQTGNVLALTLARCCSILDRLLIHYDNEDVIGGLTATEKERLLTRVAVTLGITFDKVRIATGQATSHSSHSIQIHAVHAALDFSQPSSGLGSKDVGPQPSPSS